MKKILCGVIILISLPGLLFSQVYDKSGKPIAELFTNFHCSLNDDTTTGFGLTRAFIGYNYLPAQKLSATIMLNIGNPEDLPADAEPRRYAYVREASFTYSLPEINLVFGITTTRLFGAQQKFWGKRYLAEPLETYHEYGYNADLGVVVDYMPSETVTLDFSVTNGEGYSNIQLDNNVKTSAGITLIPLKKMTLRLYGDILIPGNKLHTTLLCFAGFKNELVTIGAEVIYQTSHELIDNHNILGFSGTGSVVICKNTELFTRYDHSVSVKNPAEGMLSHTDDNEDFLIGGIQYSFNNNLRMALNYQRNFPTGNAENSRELIYLNTRFYF